MNAFNRFFNASEYAGIAHRKKQHRFSSQLCDVLVDSPHPRFYLAIENKSVKTSSANKLYFSQHFSESDGGHQVDRISEFVDRSGRTGYLSVELKRGRGRQRKAYLVPWDVVREAYADGETGLHLDTVRDCTEVVRDGEDYDVAAVSDRF